MYKTYLLNNPFDTFVNDVLSVKFVPMPSRFVMNTLVVSLGSCNPVTLANSSFLNDGLLGSQHQRALSKCSRPTS